jgi:hypothetical protein
MEGDGRNTILVAGKDYHIPSFSESFMEEFTAKEVTYNLTEHHWVAMSNESTHEICTHCYKLRIIKS